MFPYDPKSRLNCSSEPFRMYGHRRRRYAVIGGPLDVGAVAQACADEARLLESVGQIQVADFFDRLAAILLQKTGYLAAEHGIVKNQSAHVSHVSDRD